MEREKKRKLRGIERQEMGEICWEINGESRCEKKENYDERKQKNLEGGRRTKRIDGEMKEFAVTEGSLSLY